MTSNVLGRPNDDTYAFDAGILAPEPKGSLRRHGFDAAVLRPPMVIDGVTLDVSAGPSSRGRRRLRGRFADPARGRQRGSVGVPLAPEHYDLLKWATTRLLRQVSASAGLDVHTIAGELSRAADGGR